MFIMFLRDKIVLISLLSCKQQGTKKEQRKLMRVLCLLWFARHASRARTKKWKVLFTPALLERERERERERESIQIFGTTKYLAIFFSFFSSPRFCKLHIDATIFTPLLYKV